MLSGLLSSARAEGVLPKLVLYELFTEKHAIADRIKDLQIYVMMIAVLHRTECTT